MRKKICIFLQSLLMVGYYLVSTMETAATLQEKAESTIPITTMSPPEGNTTFVGGTTWCVAQPGASQDDLQDALDWACGLGMTDCDPIQKHGPCFEPDTLLSHASYAFNAYYQQNGNSDIACNFGGTATIVTKDPSYGHCSYAASGSVSSAPPPPLSKLRFFLCQLFGILLLLFLKNSG